MIDQNFFRNVTIYDPSSKTFTTGPQTKVRRVGSTCNVFKRAGRPWVIVGGGHNTVTAEVLDYTNSINAIASDWQLGELIFTL